MKKGTVRIITVLFMAITLLVGCVTCHKSRTTKSGTEGDMVELSPFYYIEMSPHGHIFDDEAYFHHVFDDSWIISHRTIVEKNTPNGYIVEGHIVISESQSFGIKVNAGFYLGVFKAYFTKEDENTATWYSWINPQVEEAKFHIPSAFRKSQRNQ